MSKSHGGQREGAGRPPVGPEPKVPYSVRLPADLVRWLRAQDQSQADLIEAALRDHYGQ